ncbi:MAG: DUF2520 domain-containing protein [Actinobacteria bacterium]|uniref:Unannotated protein n=1 Tax=freshwater metagenome TaxID=449393 RepID=A0A6J6C071_9ZZZZ|nr:DUF2520 domain-containing protein [Actinomycetota bacterium]
MKIGVIGNEPAGPVLAKAWANAGHDLVGVYVETPAAIDRVEALLPDVPIAPMAAVVEAAELIILAIPPADIDLTVAGLADMQLFGPRKIVLHLSPHRGYGVLADAAQQGAIPIAMHPLMHFTGTSMDITVMKGATFVVSTPDTYRAIAQALVIEIGAEPFELTEFQRAAYAEAFEVARDFSSLVVQQAMGILAESEVSHPAQLIGPVVRSAVDDALATPIQPIDPRDAQ